MVPSAGPRHCFLLLEALVSLVEAPSAPRLGVGFCVAHREPRCPHLDAGGHVAPGSPARVGRSATAARWREGCEGRGRPVGKGLGRAERLLPGWEVLRSGSLTPAPLIHVGACCDGGIRPGPTRAPPRPPFCAACPCHRR